MALSNFHKIKELIKEIKLRRFFIKDFLITLIGTLSAAIIDFFITFLYVKFLPQKEFGTLAILRTFIYLVTFVSPLGIPQAILRYYPEYETRDEAKKLHDISLTGVLCLSFLFFVIIFLPLPRLVSQFKLGEESYVLLLGITLSLPVFNLVLSKLYWLRANKLFSKYSLAIFLTSLLNALIGMIILSLGEGLTQIIQGIIFTNIIVYLFLIQIDTIKNFVFNIDLKTSKKLLKFGIPVMLSQLFMWVITYSDRWMIQYFLDIKQVAIYSFANSILIPFNLIMTAPINTIIAPHIMKLWVKTNINEVIYILESVLQLIFFIFPFLFISLIFFDKEIVLFLATKEYLASTKVLPFLGLSSFCLSLLAIYGLPFFISSRNNLLLGASLLGTIINLVLNFVLIPKVGILGAAIASGISCLLSVLLAIVFSQKILHLKLVNKQTLKNLALLLFLSPILCFFYGYSFLPKTAVLLTVFAIYGFFNFHHQTPFKRPSDI